MDILSTVVQVISSILIPVLVFWFGTLVTKALKEREINVKYVEIALDILKDKPEERQFDLREWAVEVIDKHSEVKLPASVKTGLVKEQPLTNERWFEIQKKYYERFSKE